MDRLGGHFGAYDDAEPDGADCVGEPEDHAPLAPPSPVGQDERRMQVRAYNHWASLLGTANFPDIADLQPEALDDFGPHGVLLDFRGKRGVDNPTIRFLGAALAGECGGEAQFKRLSDVPGGSLLSRITDHYLQILANQAPIGFEAEFVNRNGAEVLYRGILLPWSSDGETIDFVFGVINWKEQADAATADALLSAIDAALEAPIAPYEGKDMDRMLDLARFAEESGSDDEPASLPRPAFGAAAAPGETEELDLPAPSPFDLIDEADEDEDEGEDCGENGDEDSGAASEWGAGFSGFGDEDTVYSVDYGDQGLEDGEADEDFEGVVDPLGDQTASLGLSSLVSRSGRIKQSVVLPGMSASQPLGEPHPDVSSTPAAAFAVPQAYAPKEMAEPGPSAIEADHALELGEALEETGEHGLADSELLLDLADEAESADADEPQRPAATGPVFDDGEPEGLYDCLAAARELAQTARSNEDRGRKALYQAVARAYDFSLEAAANPAEFDELVADNRLTVQDRAPMTPIVKLVFGADYDKTRLTEYAAVLGYAHRTGVARGTLDAVLAKAEGGLKGVVRAERQARKAIQGKPVEAPMGVRNALAKKLRKVEPVGLAGLANEGAEFALVMVRRLPSGELAVLGEVPEDVALVEKAARKLLA